MDNVRCLCECNRGGFCGGCGHAGCGGRRQASEADDAQAEAIRHIVDASPPLAEEDAKRLRALLGHDDPEND